MSEEVRNVNYVGIDIGSTASKVVVRGTSDMQFVLPTGWSSKETTQTIKEKLKENDVDVLGDETKVVATGYGRIAVDFADYVITEITCHARGGRELAGGDCTVIDVGGQDTKVILIENGMVQDFLMNDKCSAGTGKFLEIMANRLGVTLQELFDLAEKGTVLPISSLCTVFVGIRSYQLYWRRQKQGGYRSRCCGLCCDEGSAACYAKGNDRPCHPDRRTESQRIFYKTPF